MNNIKRTPVTFISATAAAAKRRMNIAITNIGVFFYNVLYLNFWLYDSNEKTESS